ncbi:MAG TPA: alpha/beta hydrolase [Methanotrichaceae archaeon]|nr:alpha/beta hydrolase [Methanotrichaceae archaeon]
MKSRAVVVMLAIGCIMAAFIGVLWLSDARQEWRVSDEGLLEYSTPMPEFQITPVETSNASALYEVKFDSRGTEVAGLLLVPQAKPGAKSPGIVLLPGATVTKEKEQGLAKYLCSLGYASLTIDQRNLGGIEVSGDLVKFSKGDEPVEYEMVHDALAAAEVLRNQPEIDPKRIIYAGESNGGRFAIIACALDPSARGVLAISTCGYGTDAAIASQGMTDPVLIRFYRSIDPDSYLIKIPPRRLAMIHSQNDTVIPLNNANQTYALARQPKKDMHFVGCAKHGYCTQMNPFIEKELALMSSGSIPD